MRSDSKERRAAKCNNEKKVHMNASLRQYKRPTAVAGACFFRSLAFSAGQQFSRKTLAKRSPAPFEACRAAGFDASPLYWATQQWLARARIVWSAEARRGESTYAHLKTHYTSNTLRAPPEIFRYALRATHKFLSCRGQELIGMLTIS